MRNKGHTAFTGIPSGVVTRLSVHDDTVFARRKMMSMSISGTSSLTSMFQTSSTTSNQQIDTQDGQMRPHHHHGEQGGGKLMSALTSALSQMGISLDGVSGTSSTSSTASSSSSSDTSSTSSTSSTSDSSSTSNSAVKDFMQTLMAALHAQGKANSGSGGDGDGDSDDNNSSSAVNSYKGGNPMKKDLDSLISQLTGSSSSSSSSSTSSTDSTTSDLQTKFAAMISSLGGDSSTASLGDFLKNFSSSLSDHASSQGNMISTQA